MALEQTHDDFIEYDPAQFDMADRSGDPIELMDEIAELALVRARGLSLSGDLISMIAPLGLREEDRRMIRAETKRQILHEIAVLREAADDPYRPSSERIAARALDPILGAADAARLARVAADLEMPEPNTRQFNAVHPAGQDRQWRRAADRWGDIPGNRGAGAAALLPRYRGNHAGSNLTTGGVAYPVSSRPQRLPVGRAALHSGADHRGREGLRSPRQEIDEAPLNLLPLLRCVSGAN